MKIKRFSEEKIIGYLKEVEAGVPVKESCRKRGFSDTAFFRTRYSADSIPWRHGPCGNELKPPC
jgi:putative transposase